MLRTAPPGRHVSGRHSRQAQENRREAVEKSIGRAKEQTGRNTKWHGPALTLALALTAAGFSFHFYPSRSAIPLSDFNGAMVDTVPNFASLLGTGEVSSFSQLPAPIVTGTAAAPPRKPARAKPAPAPAVAQQPTASAPTDSAPVNSGSSPLGGASYAGPLQLSETGSQLTSWNATSSYCSSISWQLPDGKVGTDANGDATISTSGAPGSCVALISPQSYSSAVIEADIDFPALPGSSGTIANWTSFWLTNGAAWPTDGELDAVEAEPVTGVNAVAWHSGTSGNEFSASTDDFFPTQLPKEGPNLTPGWHTVDIVYTQGFVAVYYDGQQYTSYSSGNVTGAALNIYLTTGVAPDNSQVEQTIGGTPKNSDSQPATMAIKYLKVWSFK
jgi:hypothetical protein